MYYQRGMPLYFNHHPEPYPEGWHAEVDELGTWRYCWGTVQCGVILKFRPENEPFGDVILLISGQRVQHRDRLEVTPFSFSDLQQLAVNAEYFSAPDPR
jgi:hypothetical protein